MKISEDLKRVVKENAEAISGSETFLVLWSEKMVEEVIPLVQMGYVVYSDKPVLILVPERRRHEVTRNLEKLALAIETYDDTLSRDELMMNMQAATMRLMERAGVVKP